MRVEMSRRQEQALKSGGGLMRILAAAMAGRVALAVASPASAFMAYVSNEKDNTVTVVDTTTMQVVKTINTGQRPRGITISHDGKFVYLCASDDDTIEIIDTATQRDRRHAAVRPRPRALRALARRQDALRRQRGRQSRHRHRHRKQGRHRRRSRSASSRKAWASAPTARRWSTRRKRRTWRISSTPRRMRSQQRAGRCAAALCRVHPRRQGSLGQLPRSAARCRSSTMRRAR